MHYVDTAFGRRPVRFGETNAAGEGSKEHVTNPIRSPDLINGPARPVFTPSYASGAFAAVTDEMAQFSHALPLEPALHCRFAAAVFLRHMQSHIQGWIQI